MYNKGFHADCKFKVHKLSVGKAKLKLRLQCSKRNNSKIKKKNLNSLSINNDNNNANNSKIINNNHSHITRNKEFKNNYVRDEKFIKYLNARNKLLELASNNNDYLNFNNFLTHDDIYAKNINKINNNFNNSNDNSINKKNKSDKNFSNNNENVNANNSYIHITLNSKNPYLNQNDEKENDYNIISTDLKYDITVNKICHNNHINHNNVYNNNINNYNTINNNANHNNVNDNNINSCNALNNNLSHNNAYDNNNIDSSNGICNYDNNNNAIVNNDNNNVNNNVIITKGRLSVIEDVKNRANKKNRRDLSAQPRKDNLNFNKKIILIKEKNNSNINKKKNYSPLIETKEPKYLNHSNMNSNNLNYYSHHTQKTKSNLSNINSTSFSNIPNTSNNNNNSNIIGNPRIQTNPNDEEYFEYNDDKAQELTKDEKIIYGDRIMKGYIKKKLLGKGGCGIVWLCTKINDENNNEVNKEINININQSFGKENVEEYAVKQTSKKNGNALMNMANENIITAKNEIKILSKLNEEENNTFIPKIYNYYEDNNDIWFSFEKGGISISGLCLKIKGEFEKGERIYFIQKGRFLISLFSTISQFKYLLKSLLSAIDYINQKGIIHSDIKPENILIEYKGDSNEKNFEITSIKIIDFGSAFLANNTAAVTSNTPEYLCPEITNSNKKFIKELKNNNMKYINCIDIWSLGITILELCLCCPIWMNYKTKVIINGKIYHSSGLFGCRGRDAGKIYQKQVELSKNFQKKLKNSMIYMFEQKDRDNFIDLLKKMLELDYKKRITCQDAIKHQFFND